MRKKRTLGLAVLAFLAAGSYLMFTQVYAQQPAGQQPPPAGQQPQQPPAKPEQPQQPAAKPAQQPQQPMSFFVTSEGSGRGGDLGGLEGADKHCQQLASAVGAGNRTWRAYLSAAAAAGQPPVNARDRIGEGPWYNQQGALIAANVADLHGDHERDRNNIRKPTATTEKGDVVPGSGDTPNQHDILTGSDSHGRIPVGAAAVLTCNNWTSSSDTERAIVGHSDRLGGPNASWNAVHSTAGCSQEALIKTGGAGFFYCFAAD